MPPRRKNGEVQQEATATTSTSVSASAAPSAAPPLFSSCCAWFAPTPASQSASDLFLSHGGIIATEAELLPFIASKSGPDSHLLCLSDSNEEPTTAQLQSSGERIVYHPEWVHASVKAGRRMPLNLFILPSQIRTNAINRTAASYLQQQAERNPYRQRLMAAAAARAVGPEMASTLLAAMQATTGTSGEERKKHRKRERKEQRRGEDEQPSVVPIDDGAAAAAATATSSSHQLPPWSAVAPMQPISVTASSSSSDAYPTGHVPLTASVTGESQPRSSAAADAVAHPHQSITHTHTAPVLLSSPNKRRRMEEETRGAEKEDDTATVGRSTSVSARKATKPLAETEAVEQKESRSQISATESTPSMIPAALPSMHHQPPLPNAQLFQRHYVRHRPAKAMTELIPFVAPKFSMVIPNSEGEDEDERMEVEALAAAATQAQAQAEAEAAARTMARARVPRQDIAQAQKQEKKRVRVQRAAPQFEPEAEQKSNAMQHSAQQATPSTESAPVPVPIPPARTARVEMQASTKRVKARHSATAPVAPSPIPTDTAPHAAPSPVPIPIPASAQPTAPSSSSPPSPVFRTTEWEQAEETLQTSSSRALHALAQLLHMNPADDFEELTQRPEWRKEFKTRLIRHWRSEA